MVWNLHNYFILFVFFYFHLCVFPFDYEADIPYARYRLINVEMIFNDSRNSIAAAKSSLFIEEDIFEDMGVIITAVI